jgi:hypothetical protein
MTTMAELLEQWTSDTLKSYLALLGGATSITRKGERINVIRQKLLDKGSLRTIWQQLDEVAKRAVSTAYHNEGEFNADAFVAQYGQLPPRPQREGWYSYYHKEPILFDLFVIGQQIPADLMPLLADLVLPPERFQLEGIEQPPAEIEIWQEVLPVLIAETEMVGQTDLLTYLQMVEQGAVQFSPKSNRLTAGSVRKVLSNLMAGDFHEMPQKVTGSSVIRPFGLDVFTQEAGLVTRTGKLTAAGRTYMQTQAAELMLAAFEKWAEKGQFDELTRIAQLHGLNSRETRLTPAASRRQKVIEALSWCPVNVWIDIEAFYRAVKVWHFDFEVEATQFSNLYVGPYRDYGYMDGNQYWTLVNGLYINAVIWEYLAVIGALDLAYVSTEMKVLDTELHYSDEALSLHEGLLYFRINDWGAYLLGQAGTYVRAKAKKKALFTIDRELKVHLLADLLPNERLQLEVMAESVDGRTYQLDRQKVLTAVEGGQKLEWLLDFLQANHQGELPKAAADWLAQLKRNQGAFKEAGTAVLIRLKRRDLTELVQQDELLAKMCQQVDEQTLLVPSARLTSFRKRLKELGYLVS